MRGQIESYKIKQRGSCLIVALLSFLFVSQLQAENKPKLSIDNPTFDFGTVSQGTVLNHEFVIKNLGNADLNIQRVVPACGCTVASVSPDNIAPGSQGKIKVEFDTTDFSGDKLKLVRLFTNDIDAQMSSLTIKGIVEPNLLVEPARVFMGDLVRLGPVLGQAKEVSAKVRPGSSVKILGVSSLSSNLILKVLEQSSTSLKFSVAIAGQAQLGELRERLVVDLEDSKGKYSVNVPVFAIIVGQVKLNPATISMGLIEGTKAYEKFVKLENLGSQPINITKLESADPAITASFKVIEAGKRFVIHVVVDPLKLKRDLKSHVKVFTSNATEEPLQLNVFGALAPK